MSDLRFDTTAVVLGMHRSGTSALAGVLALTGLTAPRTLLPSSAVNERGFWESEPIKALNDELFAEHGANWHSLDSINLRNVGKRRLRSVSKRIESVLSEEFAPGSRPLIKDPRLCRLLPYWRPAFESLSERTVYAVMLRNPVEVARSLTQRNEFDADLSYLLWARYYLEAEFHTRGLPRAWIAYDRLVEDWRGSLDALASKLGTELRVDSAIGEDVSEFISAELRHHRTTDEQGLLELERFPSIQHAYRILLDWSHGRRPTDKDTAVLDQSRRQFDQLTGAVSNIAENARLDRKRVASAKAQTDVVAGELKEARKALENLEGLRASQTRLEERIESAVASLDEAIQQRLNIEQQLSETLLEAGRERSGLQRMVAEAEDAAKRERAGFEQKLSDGANTNEALRKEIDRLRAGFEQKLSDAANVNDALRKEVDRVRAGFEQKLGDAANANEALRKEIDRLRAGFEQKLGDAANANEALRNEIDRLRAGFEQKLGDAANANEALRTEIDRVRTGFEQQLSEATFAKNALSKEIDRLGADKKKTVQSFEDKVEALETAHDDLETELKDVKRKYRSTQHQLGRDREKLRRTQEQLAQTEEMLVAIRGSAVWRIYTGIQRAIRGTGGKIRRILGGGDRRRRGEQLAMLRASSLFDEGWYLHRYADVAAAGRDAAAHYLESGWREGRDPGPCFSTSSYLRSNGDVFRAGINPLLHFIEFGYSEGRNFGEVHASVATKPAESGEQFGPAAPCLSFNSKERSAFRWRRAARLSAGGDGLIVIDGESIGLVKDPIQVSRVHEAFDRLASLSGRRSPARQLAKVNLEGAAQSSLQDVWFANNGRLRCRWRIADQPRVVRAYQHDPHADGGPCLVGEALVASTIDFVDADLKNPYFPVLFVLSEPDGNIQDTEVFAFPSLSRGGLHYPELVALEDRTLGGEVAPFDVMRQSEWLAGRLSNIVDRGRVPFLGRLAVDLAGADGTEPLFQSDFQAWLSNVVQVGLEPLPVTESSSAFLTKKARLPIAGRKEGSTLILPADAIPSIEVLTAAAGGGTSDRELAVSVAVANADPSQPSKLIALPAGGPANLALRTKDYIAPWPRFLDSNNRAPAEQLELAAIRHPRRSAATGPEMLVPVAQPALQVDGLDKAITWLIFPEDWEDDALRQSLEALSLQQGACRPIASLVGEVSDSLAAIAARLFNDRLSMTPDLTSALDAVATPLVGYLGRHVILHDARTSRALSALLDDSSVVSASCVLVSAEKHGKGWHVSVADGGSFRRGDQKARTPEQLQDPLLFWRSTYPALRPPRDLWLGRSASVKGWLQRAGPLRPEEGVQLCTSVVTASYVAASDDRPAHLSPPASAEQRAIRTEMLFG